jgi:general L-amino acid transport system permease protein
MATTQPYVRTEMLSQQIAPLTERGAVKWVRENLFSGVFNTVLTLLGIVILYYLVQAILPWLLNGVWDANSLTECRQIIAANAGDGASGACWALIRERWHQWLFGFYPQDQYWRPVLAFVLLFVALAPVLFSGQRNTLLAVIGVAAVLIVILLPLGSASWLVLLAALVLLAGLATLVVLAPRWLYAFTLLYAPLCFFLLWGGSVWGPIFVLIGLAITIAAGMQVARGAGRIFGTVAFVLLFAMIFLDPVSPILNIAGSLMSWIQGETVIYNPILLDGVPPLTLRNLFPLLPHATGLMADYLQWGLSSVASDEFGGFLLAITIGVTAISFSLPLGIILALGRQSDMLIVKTLCVGFIEFIRGVPLITLLFTASLLLQYFLPPSTNFDIILRVIILVTLFSAAYLAEVIRGGLAALPRGQYEAADALGLDYWRAQRLIILPQALKISIPSIVSTFIGLFKDTTLVSFVGLLDPLRGVTNMVRADINWKGIYWEPYIFVGAIFFFFCFSMSRYSMYLEQRLKTDHR